MTYQSFLLMLMIVLNVINYGPKCQSTIVVHQHRSVVCIASKQPLKVSMTLHNLIGNAVHDWGKLKLKRGTNIFDCSGIVRSRGIYILVVDAENIHIVKKIILNP